MKLSDILKKTEKKLKCSKIMVRKPEISTKDRPYSEFVPYTTLEVSQEELMKASTVIEIENVIETLNISTTEDLVCQSSLNIERKNNLINTKQSNLVISSNNDASSISHHVHNSYTNLSGNEKRLMDYICGFSLKNNDLQVGPFSTKEIVEQTGIKEKSIKQTINRLKTKGFLQKSSKRGSGGWRIFQINSAVVDVYQGIVKKKAFNDTLIQNISTPKVFKENLLPGLDTMLPKEWEDLDINGLEEFGFTKNHLIQLYQDISTSTVSHGKEILNIDSIQHSLYCFRWDLQNYYADLKVKYASPIKMFVGTLRKGRPYNSIKPETFKTPEQIQWEIYRQQIDKKKTELEQIKKQAFTIEFQNWRNNLSTEEIQDILPEEIKTGTTLLSVATKTRLTANALQKYFEDYIWPNYCKQFLSEQKTLKKV